MRNANEGWRWYQLVAALAGYSALLNLVWELFAASQYVMPGPMAAQHGISPDCVLATVGDVGITLAAYAAGSAIGTRDWIRQPSATVIAIYLGVGLSGTAFLEYLNVTVLHRWAYGASMPTIVGIGMLPLLQWILLPPLALALTRRHLRSASVNGRWKTRA